MDAERTERSLSLLIFAPFFFKYLTISKCPFAEATTKGL